MKKGFTLIELLAVIVILAIISVIAVPIVLNIIDETKNNAGLRSAEMYVKAAELSIAQATLKNKNITDGTYEIKDGDICLDDDCTDKLEIEVNGEVPESGTITITNGNISHLSIVLNEKEIYKNSKGELVYVKTLNDVCKSVKEQKYASNPLEAGYKYECKVDPNKEPYTFYVLNTRNKSGEIITETSIDKEAVSINLIMAQNVNSDGTPVTKAIKESEKNNNGGIYNMVAWITKEDYLNTEIGGTEVGWDSVDDDMGNNDKGPITAMNFLSKATKTWTNINEMIINSFDSYYEEDFNNPYNDKNYMKLYNTYARMPYLNEITQFTIDNVLDLTNKMWLIDYLTGEFDDDEGIIGREHEIDGIEGYWTSSADIDIPQYALSVSAYGWIDNPIVDYEAWGGVRPVITLNL